MMAADAQPGLPGSRRIVETAMDHLAAARADAAAEALGRFDDQGFQPARGKRPRTGQADHAGADDHHIHLVHAVQLAPPVSAGQYPRRATARSSLGLQLGGQAAIFQP